MSDVQLGVTKDGGSCELVDISLIDSLAIVYSSTYIVVQATKVKADPFEGSNFSGPVEHYGVSGDWGICPHLLMAGEISLFRVWGDNMPNQICILIPI